MLVAALNKQYASREMPLSFNSSKIELIGFDISKSGQKVQKINLNLLVEFLNGNELPQGEKIKNKNTVFRNVRVDAVESFIKRFEVDESVSGTWKKKPILDYLSRMKGLDVPELTDWTVVLYSTQNGNSFSLGEYLAKPLKRKNMNIEMSFRLNSNLTSAADEGLDFFESDLRKIAGDRPLGAIKGTSIGRPEIQKMVC